MASVEKSGTGVTRAHWRSVAALVPPQGRLVLIAYRFMEDDELTVDLAERDGDQWVYLGGGPIDEQHGQVMFWAPVPEAPALPAQMTEAA